MPASSDFAKLMEELGLPRQSTQTPGADLAPLVAPSDISNLSIQAKKALPQKSLPLKSQPESILPKPSKDAQGNSVRISREADRLSAVIRPGVAWETRIWPETLPEIQNSDKA